MVVTHVGRAHRQLRIRSLNDTVATKVAKAKVAAKAKAKAREATFEWQQLNVIAGPRLGPRPGLGPSGPGTGLDLKCSHNRASYNSTEAYKY